MKYVLEMSSSASDGTEAQSAENWFEIEFCEISTELYLAPVIHLHATETPHYSIPAKVRGDLNQNHYIQTCLSFQVMTWSQLKVKLYNILR